MKFTETPSLNILCQAKLQADILKNGMLILPKGWEEISLEYLKFVACPTLYHSWIHKDKTKNMAVSQTLLNN